MSKDYLSQVVKDFEGVSTGGDNKMDLWVNTGSLALNKAISGSYQKGFPFGRVVDIFGDPSTGKSLLIYHILANVQKMGGVAILDDTEDAYVKEFGATIGIDNSELIMLNSLTVEEHFEKVFLGWKDSKGKAKKSLVDLILENDADCPIVVALDSVALLSTRHEQEVKFEKPDMIKAKQIRAGMRMVSGHLQSNNILHLISNHLISKIGIVFGNPKTTPGGSGIPFQASVRVELSTGKKIKDKDNEEKKLGIQSKVYIAKNKISAPFKETTLDIYFDRGVDPYSGIQDLMVSDGVLVAEEGNKFTYTAPDGKKEVIRGFKFGEWIQAHQDLLV